MYLGRDRCGWYSNVHQIKSQIKPPASKLSQIKSQIKSQPQNFCQIKSQIAQKNAQIKSQIKPLLKLTCKTLNGFQEHTIWIDAILRMSTCRSVSCRGLLPKSRLPHGSMPVYDEDACLCPISISQSVSEDLLYFFSKD